MPTREDCIKAYKHLKWEEVGIKQQLTEELENLAVNIQITDNIEGSWATFNVQYASAYALLGPSQQNPAVRRKAWTTEDVSYKQVSNKQDKLLQFSKHTPTQTWGNAR